MEIENEFLIAVNGEEFYYQGVPSTGTVIKEETKTDFSEIACVVDDTSGASAYILRTVGYALTITQLIMCVVGVLCIFKGMSNIRKNKEIEDIDNGLNRDDPINQENVRKKATIPYFVFSAMLLLGCGIINIVKNFAAKPIIYIYPEEETEVRIKVKNPEKLTCTYPKYENEWNVLAKPNGDLIDLKTNRKLYALYWEGLNTTKTNIKKGFIVEGEKVAKFLEEKLEILGLNEREAEEFIVYWLPLMEKNKYNYIRFESKQEIDENMELEITPAPETLIRINMEFKGLRKPIQVEEQKLEKVERKGYTVVEWGGTRL